MLRLLFLGCQPGPVLGQRLTKSGFQLFRDRLPPGLPTAELVVRRVLAKESPEAVEESLRRLRKDHPAAWLVALTTRKRLSDPEFSRALLDCGAHDDVWTVGSWEALFWMNLQRAQREQTLRLDLQRAKDQGLEQAHSQSTRLVNQLEEDVELATNIQRSLLPKRYPEIPGVQLVAKYLPSSGVGGDYYDIFEFGDRRRFGILLADSKTHGMAAALLAALLKVRLEEMKDRFPDSRSFVEHLHAEMQQFDAPEHASLSLLYGILDRSQLTFQFTAAGHLAPILWRDRKAEPTTFASTPALGERLPAQFHEYTLQLQPGDLLLLHTDGLDQVLSKKKFHDLLHAAGTTPNPADVQRELLGEVDRHKSERTLADDVTLLQLAVGARALYLSRSK